jgi:hypothetical protein
VFQPAAGEQTGADLRFRNRQGMRQGGGGKGVAGIMPSLHPQLRNIEQTPSFQIDGPLPQTDLLISSPFAKAHKGYSRRYGTLHGTVRRIICRQYRRQVLSDCGKG